MTDVEEAGPKADLPAQKRRARRYPRRERTVLVRLSDEEHAAVSKAAERAGLRPAGFVADAALAAAEGRTLGDRGALQVALAKLVASENQLRRVGTNLNQAVAELNTTGRPPVWLGDAVERVDRAVAQNEAAADELAGRLLRGQRGQL